MIKDSKELDSKIKSIPWTEKELNQFREIIQAHKLKLKKKAVKKTKVKNTKK